MTPLDVLNNFAEYADFREEKKSFSLFGDDYHMNKVCKAIKKTTSTFDTEGRMSVLYAKQAYLEHIRDTRIRVSDIFDKPDRLAGEIKMHDMFFSETVRQIEQEYINALNAVIERVIGVPVLGERDLDKEREVVMNSLSSVVSNLFKLKEDVYVYSGRPIQPVQFIGTEIAVFDTMAECMLVINNARDGMYLCFISNHGSADGYFAIMIKSNGNLFSLNDRSDEEYIGSHGRSRNASWAEDHKDNLFPYGYILKFGKYDYKGYATEYKLDAPVHEDGHISFSDLPVEAYIPAIIAMICVSASFANKALDQEKQVYSNTFLKSNLPSIVNPQDQQNALATIEKNELVVRTREELDIHFDASKFMRDDYSAEYRTTATFNSKGQEYVEDYASGFVLNQDYLRNDAISWLSRKQEAKEIHPEFIAPKSKMRRQAYYEARIQLARYIEDAINQEVASLGGLTGILRWYQNAVSENLDTLNELVTKAYCASQSTGPEGAKNIHMTRYFWMNTDGEWEEDTEYSKEHHIIGFDGKADLGRGGIVSVQLVEAPQHIARTYPNPRKDHSLDRLCNVNVKTCSLFFIISPFDAKAIESLICRRITSGDQVSIPKIVRHWLRSDLYYGNSILDVIDPVEAIVTPMRAESQRFFDIEIGYSKSGMNQLVKQFKLGSADKQ